MSRVFKMTVASIHTLYVNKAVRKGRTEDEVNTVIQWLTGFDSAELGVSDAVLDHLVGHAPSSVWGKHYAAPSLEQQRKAVALIPPLRLED